MKVTITNEAGELREYLQHLVNNPKIPSSCFDLETTGLRVADEIIMLSFYDGLRNPFVAYTDAVFEDGIPMEVFIDLLVEYMPQLTVFGHNIKYDLGVLRWNKVPDPKVSHDTLLMCHVWDPDQLKNLETRVSKDLGYAKKTYKAIIGKGWDKIDWDADVKESIDKKGEKHPPLITPQNMGTYAGEDTYWCWKLRDYYIEKLTRPMLRILHEVEMPLMWMLRDMHHDGVRVDPTVLAPLDKKLDAYIRATRDKVYDVAGEVFNLNSPKQMGKILYEDMGIVPIKKTKGGAWSTDSASLKEYALDGWPIAQHLVDYSQYEQLKTMYTAKIPLLIDSDGRLRASFNQAATGTSRFSSSDPNLQNLPARTTLGLQVREAFIPAPGWDMWVADWSQIEPRLATHMSEDPGLIKIYKNRGDIYVGLAEALGITRDEAKIVLLAIFYGIGPTKLSRSIHKTLRDTKIVIKGVYQSYPVFAKWKEEVENYIKRHKCVINMFGQIRRFPNCRPEAGDEMYFASLRAGFNAMIQGSAALMMKIAMVRIHERMDRQYERVLMTVHDELIGESVPSRTEHAVKVLLDCMENSVKLKIPVIAEHKIVHNWAEMKAKNYKGIDLSERHREIPLSILFR